MGPLLFHENITFYLETHAIIVFYCVRNCVSLYLFLVQAQKGEQKKAADSFLAAFFICDPSKALEAYDNSPVDYSSERRWRDGIQTHPVDEF